MRLLDEAIAAHGGRERFAALERLRLRLTVGGLAWPVRGMRAPFELDATVELHRPAVAFAGLPEVDLAARPRFGLRWSAYEQAWFCAMALWNYTTLPWLLERCEVEELPGRRVRARFPAGVPTHSPVQTFHLDDAGRIARHDYTATAFGRWAAAQHRSTDFQTFGGLVLATRRRVTPRGLPLPVLVSIAVHDGEVC
ncbi:MAG TPA: hypothetical protein VFR97_12320 [Capillimicrobium sp.]|nr:hypothetical protein [Capillimicrobium sp.]